MPRDDSVYLHHILDWLTAVQDLPALKVEVLRILQGLA